MFCLPPAPSCLCYQARQFGMRDKIFDLLDEAPMLPSQIKELCDLLFSGPNTTESTLPEPQEDPDGFLHAVDHALEGLPNVLDVRTGAQRRLINMRELKRSIHGRSGHGAGCTVS
eukprot:5602469-Pleurochrysis_carterae.AAC.1